jgi:hypothetical protein
VVTGLSLARATPLLNDVASHVLHAATPRPGERIPLRGGPVIEVVEIAQPTAPAPPLLAATAAACSR